MKKRVFFALAILITASLMFSSSGWSNYIQADTTKSYQDEIDAAKAKKEELEQNRQELAKKLEELKQQKDDISAYIKQLDDQTMALVEDIEQLDSDILECEQRLADTQAELEEVKQKEAEQYDTMKRRIRYMYENGDTSFLDLFLGAGSLSDIFNQLEYRTEITEYDNELLNRYNQTKLQVIDVETLLTAQLEELGSLKDTQEQELASVTELAEVKNTELLAMAAAIGADEEMILSYWEDITQTEANIEELEVMEAERIAEEERKRKEEEERLRREAEERKRREEELANLKLSQNIDNMLWPLPISGRITSDFGYRTSPTQGASTYHKGIDVGAPTGSDVVAALAGTVIAATYNSSSGYYIKIDHGGGLVTVYMHSSKLLVKTGDYVVRGQVIMKVGSTGVSTGPHLHFGIYVNGTAVDPLDYVSYN